MLIRSQTEPKTFQISCEFFVIKALSLKADYVSIFSFEWLVFRLGRWGANDASNVFGTAVGSKMVRFRTAAICCSIFIGSGCCHQWGRCFAYAWKTWLCQCNRRGFHCCIFSCRKCLFDDQSRLSCVHIPSHRRRNHRLELFQRRFDQLSHLNNNCHNMGRLPDTFCSDRAGLI